MVCLKIISERIYPRPYLGYKVGKMYLGLDIHKNICVVTQMNEQGKVVRKEKIGVDKEEIEDFFFYRKGFGTKFYASL